MQARSVASVLLCSKSVQLDTQMPQRHVKACVLQPRQTQAYTILHLHTAMCNSYENHCVNTSSVISNSTRELTVEKQLSITTCNACWMVGRQLCSVSAFITTQVIIIWLQP